MSVASAIDAQSLLGFDAAQLVLVALVMTFGSVLQGAIGFASGLVGVPLLVLCGFSLLDATIINFVCTSVQNATGAAQLWSHLETREVFWPSVFRTIGLPMGIYALGASRGFDDAHIKQIIGVLLLGAVVLLGGLRIKPREHISGAWTLVAFVSSGFLTGFASIGGAPMVLYVNSLTWSARKSRGFLFFCSASIVPFMAVLLAWRFGRDAIPGTMAALIAMPPALLGLWAGLNLGERLDKERFRHVTYALLVLIAVAAIVGPVVFKRG